jgi:hypothetical protein
MLNVVNEPRTLSVNRLHVFIPSVSIKIKVLAMFKSSLLLGVIYKEHKHYRLIKTGKYTQK